jgi:F0F1-type ATP synthase assembly protein I
VDRVVAREVGRGPGFEQVPRRRGNADDVTRGSDSERAPSWQQGFGDGLAQAVEFVLAPLLFGAVGALVDRWLGTRPTFLLLLGTFGLVGMFVTVYYRYKAEMERASEGKVWARRRG